MRISEIDLNFQALDQGFVLGHFVPLIVIEGLARAQNWAGEPNGKRGRSPSFSEAAIQFCLMIKNLYGLALGQSTGMVRSLLELAYLDWDVPDFNTLSRRQKHLQVTLTHQRRGEPLHLLIDSTGIKMLGEGECKRKKHGADYRLQWRKVHLGIDAQTLEIRAIEVTANSIGDAPMLPALLEQIPSEEPVESVGADGAYDTKARHAAIASQPIEWISALFVRPTNQPRIQ